MKLKAHSFSACGLFSRIAVLGAITVGCSLVSAASAQTEIDLNPIYKNNKSSYLSLLLRESPRKIKEVYANQVDAGQLKGDTVWVAPSTENIYARLIRSLKWPLKPVADSTNYAAKDLQLDPDDILPLDSSLICNVNGTRFGLVRVERDSVLHKGFLMCQTEVTQKLWITVMMSNPSEWTEIASGWPYYHHPVENVTWKEVNAFITRLNRMTGRKFRLPTAREWEFAAKGGLKSTGGKYAGGNNALEVAWCKPEFVIGAGTKDVAQKKPNELGLYDMSGNVWEFCADNFGRGTAEWVIIKGGCANEVVTDCEIERKRLITTNDKLPFLGFRLVEDF